APNVDRFGRVEAVLPDGGADGPADPLIARPPRLTQPRRTNPAAGFRDSYRFRGYAGTLSVSTIRCGGKVCPRLRRQGRDGRGLLPSPRKRRPGRCQAADLGLARIGLIARGIRGTIGAGSCRATGGNRLPPVAAARPLPFPGSPAEGCRGGAGPK